MQYRIIAKRKSAARHVRWSQWWSWKNIKDENKMINHFNEQYTSDEFRTFKLQRCDDWKDVSLNKNNKCLKK